MAVKSKPTKKAAKKKVVRSKSKKVRQYEGASKKKRLSRWIAPSTSAIAATSGGIVTLRNRARDLRRNNPYAARAIQVITSNVIGAGIVTQFRRNNTPASELESLWASWAESKAIDFDGRHNIYGLQRLIMEAVAESGEVLVRKRYNSLMSFPLQYQILESDFLDTNEQAPGVSGNTVIQGIEYDPQGRRVAYFLYEKHPGGYDSQLSFTQKTNRVPVEEVYHVFRQDRPGQARGITWFAPVIVRMKDLDDYEDAQLVRQKIAACFTAFVQDISADFAEEDNGEPCDEDLGDRIEPGLIEHLPTGKTITFAKPPEVQGFKDYKVTVLQGIAAGLGMTYEALAADYSNVNFSSARMGWLEFGRNIKTWRDSIMVSHCLDPIAADFLTVAAIQGAQTEGVTYTHVAPTREMIDPTKEIPATLEGIRGGLLSLSDELMAQGKDPVAHLKQYAADMELIDELGLKIEADPRNGKGSAQASNQNQGGNNGQSQDQTSG